VPNIANQLKRTLAKAGVKMSFKSGTKLKDILCAPNKTKLPQTEKRGVYALSCPCSPSSIYVGQTSHKISTRIKEYKHASETGNFVHSGISQHKEACASPVDWDNPDVITTLNDEFKFRLQYNLCIHEALEIQRRNCGQGRGLNEDWGGHVRT
jgi:hypothetical protein